MRRMRGVITSLLATAMLTTGLYGIPATGLLLIAPTAWARGMGGGVGESQQLIREGQVVEIGDTTITIHEWAGQYTYRLAPTARQSLEAYHIHPGDRVRFNVWAVWEIAYYFKKM